MWKVHLPATSYLQKQVKFFGTNHFLKAYKTNTILKSAGLFFRDDPYSVGQPHTWAPTDAGIHPDPDGHDHPPWNHHPETGELLEGGLHPIDFIHKDLMEKFGASPEKAQSIIQEAIDRYNANHPNDSNHTLPDFDSPQWRKVYAGPFYGHDTKTLDRKVRGAEPVYEGGHRPLITYSLNRANVGTPGAAAGPFLDGGFVHINKELGEVLLKEGVPEEEIYGRGGRGGLNYVKYATLRPGDLSGGIVNSWTHQQMKEAMRTGSLPEQFQTPEMQEQMAQDRLHPEVHAHQLAKLMPDSFFYPASSKTSKGGLDGDTLRQQLELMGVEHGLSDEELNEMASTRIMRMMFQTVHKLDSDSGGGSVKNLLRNMLNEIDSHHEDENYQMHLSHARGAKTDESTPFHQRANLTASNIVAHMSNAAHKLMMQGMSEEDAVNSIAQTMRESQINHNDRAFREMPEGYREKVEAVLDGMMSRTGHEQFSLGKIPTDPRTQHIQTGIPDMTMVHQFGEHWAPRVFTGDHQLAPPQNTVREEPAPMADGVGGGAGVVGVRGGAGRFSGVNVPPAPTLPPYVPPAPTLPPHVPSMIDLPPVPRQPFVPPAPNLDAMAGLQGGQRTLFDPRLYAASHDVVSDIDLLRKKLGYFDGFLRGGR